MTDKELRKLKRKDLIEILLSLSEENDSLIQENEQLKAKLDNSKIDFKSGAAIAEALQLNDIFNLAQDTANQYVKNIVQINEETQIEADEIIKKANYRSTVIRDEAQKIIDEKWLELKNRLDNYASSREEFAGLLDMIYKDINKVEKVNQEKK